jgi:AraC-like DNA-binding protein
VTALPGAAKLAISEDMNDALSLVLQAVRLTGAVYFTVDGSAPWVAETPPSDAIAAHVVPGSGHLIDYHVVQEGECWGGLVGEPPLRLEAGDVIVFPHGDAHVMASAPGLRGVADPDVHRAARASLIPVRLSMHGGGAPARLICGFLGCEARPFNPVIAALPRVLCVRSSEGSPRLRHLVELAIAETAAPSPGSATVLARLSEVLFIEAVRRYVASLAPVEAGWLSGLRDEVVGKALQQLHQEPALPWTLRRLAREVGTSRTVLVERFTQCLDMPPMQYLARWRTQLAAQRLRQGTESLAEIAAAVGYGSESALSRAFKRWSGMAPAAYRKGSLPDARP